MSDTEDKNFEAIVRIAAPLSQDQLEQFLLLVTPLTAEKLVKRLEHDGKLKSRFKATPTVTDETSPRNRQSTDTIHFDLPADSDLSSDTQPGSPRLPATVMLGPGEEEDAPQPRQTPDLLTGVKIVKLHARGAFGEVFVAQDERLSREVAVLSLIHI